MSYLCLFILLRHSQSRSSRTLQGIADHRIFLAVDGLRLFRVQYNFKSQRLAEMMELTLRTVCLDRATTWRGLVS